VGWEIRRERFAVGEKKFKTFLYTHQKSHKKGVKSTEMLIEETWLGVWGKKWGGSAEKVERKEENLFASTPERSPKRKKSPKCESVCFGEGREIRVTGGEMRDGKEKGR